MSSLPAPDAPLVLADGTCIDPVTRGVRTRTNGNGSVPHESIPRTLADLPDEPRVMNLLTCLAGYTLFGLNDDDIARALSLDATRIAAMKSLKSYRDMYGAMARAAIHLDGDGARSTMRDASAIAASKLVELLESEKPGIKLSAARDILDRTGNRPDDARNGEQRRMRATLRIEHVVRSDDLTVPDLTTVIDGELVS